MIKINHMAHNWLIHKINNRLIVEYKDLFLGRVADLGCGESPYKEDLLETASEYVGVDWENSAHDQSNVDVFADLCEPLPFHDGYADTVVSFQVMEHLAKPGNFLAECSRILRYGGTFFLTVPFMWHVHEAPHDYFRYTRFGLHYLLEQHGFCEISIKETSGFWQMMVLKFNYHTVRFARGPLRLFWIPVWWFGQAIAPHLDRLDPHPEETASYAVVARKPDVA